MSQTLTMMTGEQYLIKNTFIDGLADDADDADTPSDYMCRCRSEPQQRKLRLEVCEDDVRSRSFSDGSRSLPVASKSIEHVVAKLTRPSALSFASTCASSSSASEPLPSFAGVFKVDSTHSCTETPACPSSDCTTQLALAAGRKESNAVDTENDKEHVVEPPQDDVSMRTTVVARNFPAGYTNPMVVTLLDANGFSGKYDFVYLPVDFNTRRSFGYAFINFVTHQGAVEFAQLFNGFSKWVSSSNKVGLAEWSGSLQGLEGHIERYRDSPMMHDVVPDDVKPKIFKNGNRIAFPPPTKALKMPRRAARRSPSGK